MTDGLYAVFHRFEAFHRWPIYFWMCIQRPSCFFNLCFSCSSRSNKRRRDCLLPPPHDRLCCRAGLTAPSYSHRWPSYPSTHPHGHTCCYSPVRADEPVNPRTVVLPSAWETTAESRCLRVVPFIGLAVVHRPGALGAAWSTWSMNDIHRKSTVRGEANS